MALFIPKISKCCITGRTLDLDDEVALFPPFSHPNPTIQKCSDGVIDFAVIQSRPEFVELIDVYRSSLHGKKLIYKNDQGVLLRRQFNQIQFVFYPLLLSFSAPEASVQKLYSGTFASDALRHGKGHFEDFGLKLDYTGQKLCIESCPNKYVPSRADRKLVQILNRKGSINLKEFLKFIMGISLWQY